MGQYWKAVNLDKREYILSHKMGSGLKLWEQLANHPGPGAALIILLAAMPEARGGGDFDLDANWHGPERTFPKHNISPGPMPEEYPAVAKRTIGRWAGDRIAIVGDYAEDSDLPEEFHASKIYFLCSNKGDISAKSLEEMGVTEDDLYTDVSDDVCRVIEHELQGQYVGTGWRHFKYNDEKGDD